MAVFELEGHVGFEPTTIGLKARRAT